MLIFSCLSNWYCKPSSLLLDWNKLRTRHSRWQLAFCGFHCGYRYKEGSVLFGWKCYWQCSVRTLSLFIWILIIRLVHFNCRKKKSKNSTKSLNWTQKVIFLRLKKKCYDVFPMCRLDALTTELWETRGERGHTFFQNLFWVLESTIEFVFYSTVLL